MLQIITAADEDVVKRLLEVYRESMDDLAGNFESPAEMERAYGAFLREFVRRPGQLLLVEQGQGHWGSALRAVEVQTGQWFLEAVETGPRGLWGITRTSLASAMAQIFLEAVMPPTAHTSGRT